MAKAAATAAISQNSHDSSSDEKPSPPAESSLAALAPAEPAQSPPPYSSPTAAPAPDTNSNQGTSASVTSKIYSVPSPESIAPLKKEILDTLRPFVMGKKSGIPWDVALAAADLAPDDADIRKAVSVLLTRILAQVQGGTDPTWLNIGEDQLSRLYLLGYPDARYLLALRWRHLRPAPAYQLAKEGMEQGHPPSALLAAKMLAESEGVEGNYTLAFKAFEKAAANDNPEALYALGECYYFGKGTKRNPVAAIPLLQKAAAAGDSRAFDLLGNCYIKGFGSPINISKGRECFEKAVAMGNPSAMANLAVLYLNGEGVPKNPGQAMELLRRGMVQNDAASTYIYARCLESGIGVNKDESSARNYFVKAAQQGLEPARSWLARHPDPLPGPFIIKPQKR